MMDKEVYKEIFHDRRRYFMKLLKMAEENIANNYINDGVVYLEIAARYATEVHFGEFYNFEIEEMIKNISNKYFLNDTFPQNNIGKRNKVLHIATKIYETGGHTRLMLNWIDCDTNNDNDILLTDIEENHIPTELLKQYERKFSIYNVGHLKGIEKIKEIREYCKKYDCVILHIHPSDVYTSIALHNCPLPILFLNHADHRFWVGRNIANLFLEIRQEGANNSNIKRNIPTSHQMIFPIPLKRKKKMTKIEARKLLNIDNDEIMILSIASAYKYNPIDDNGLADCIIHISNKFKKVRFVFIGPNLNLAFWKEIKEKTNGKVDILGEITDVDSYYVAADIYLDSYPFVSLTSLLDAGKYGLPLVSVKKNMTVTDIDDIALDNNFKVNSLKELMTKLELWISNRGILEKQQFKYKDDIKKYHLLSSSSKILERAFQLSAKLDKLENKNFQNEIYEDRDFPLTYLHFKNRSREFEFLKVWAWHYEKLSREQQEIFLNYLNATFKRNSDEYYALLPYSIKHM